MQPLQLQPASLSELGKICAICQTSIVAGEEVGPCPSCSSPFHGDCWSENGGCAQYGCEQMPATVKSGDPAGPATSYWGQEEKQCPQCNQRIKVAALRCRHCGMVFASAAPTTAVEIDVRAREQQQKKTAGTAALFLFVGGLVPCTAPLALVIGGIWFLANRQVVKKLSPNRRVLAVLGLLCAALTSGALLFAAVVSGVRG